jgi:hypothetical protein
MQGKDHTEHKRIADDNATNHASKVVLTMLVMSIGTKAVWVLCI